MNHKQNIKNFQKIVHTWKRTKQCNRSKPCKIILFHKTSQKDVQTQQYGLPFISLSYGLQYCHVGNIKTTHWLFVSY